MMNETVAPQLLADERILWQGKPYSGVMLRWIDLALIPFGLFWTGSLLVATARAWEAGMGPVPQLLGLPFLAAGLYMLVGRFVVDRYLRRHLSYAVTDRRILIVRDGLWPKRTSLDLAHLPEVEIKNHPDGTGTIVFGAPELRTYNNNFGAGLGLWTPTLDATPQFIGIPDPDAVYALIESRSRR
ncbi:PH domain-containing protein [Methylobacterium indicum]|nr:PH domain-containing protein [Methylobacterium indicum]